jgi:hypothetical protein
MLRSTKANKCKHCKVRMPEDKARHVLHEDCVDPWLAAERAKKARKQEAAWRAAARVEKMLDRAKRKDLKPRNYWYAKAKVAVQASRRLEELAKGGGCMSCGRSQKEVAGTDAWKPGGLWDGGHFMSKGARPELALEPLNIWLQCKSCNGGAGKYARKGYTVNASFEANLIAKEGQELVDWLKGPHDLKHYSIEQLQAIEAEHVAKAKALKAGVE